MNSNAFESFFPIQAANISNCRQLSDRQKQDFLDAMNLDRADKKSIEDAARRYFRQDGRKLCGNAISVGQNTRVGRLHIWSAIEVLIARCRNSGDFNTARQSMTREWQNRFRDGDHKEKVNVIEEVVEFLEELHASSPPIIWAFLFVESEKPFDGVNFNELPCRLGLENISSDEYLPFEIELPSDCDARTPTAFDAGMDEHWCPGGRTCPRKECVKKNVAQSGFQEIVLRGYDSSHSSDGLNMWDAAKPPKFHHLAVVKK